jgi:hypothetical protein
VAGEVHVLRRTRPRAEAEVEREATLQQPAIRGHDLQPVQQGLKDGLSPESYHR